MTDATRQANTLSTPIESDAFAWLDTLAAPLQEAVHRLFRSGKTGMAVKSLLNGTPFRHRMHPALIVVPLGAWSTAAFLDFLDARQSAGSVGTYGASADASIALGLVAALPSAAAGLADWVDTYDHPRRVGMAHALLNTAALALYGVSLGLRLAGGEQRGTARRFSTLGLGLVTLSGALGGELVYNLAVNVPWALVYKLDDTWTDAIASADLPEGAHRAVEVEHVAVLLYRLGGTVYAVDALCTHAGGPLGEGAFEGCEVECPWHQSRFDLRDGRPTQGPATAPLRTYEVREEGGRIRIRPSYASHSWPPSPAPPEMVEREQTRTAT